MTRRVGGAVAALFLVAVASVLVARGSVAQVSVPTIPLPTTTVPPPELPPPPTPPTTAPPTTTQPPVPDTTPPSTDTTAVTEPAVPAPVGTPATAAPAPPGVVAPVTATTLLVTGLRPASVTGAYGIGFATVLLAALLLIVLTTLARSQLVPGGSPMSARRRARLLAGIACLALAAIAGLVGYLKLSVEPDVNRQIPYLASAGMAIVILATVGGALIVGEQMRTDQERIEELEAAVQHLAAIVGPTVEAPARTRRRVRA